MEGGKHRKFIEERGKLMRTNPSGQKKSLMYSKAARNPMALTWELSVISSFGTIAEIISWAD